jgi:hypothetical protein
VTYENNVRMCGNQVPGLIAKVNPADVGVRRWLAREKDSNLGEHDFCSKATKPAQPTVIRSSLGTPDERLLCAPISVVHEVFARCYKRTLG